MHKNSHFAIYHSIIFLGLLLHNYLRGHPYITSAQFWNFFDPPTVHVSINSTESLTPPTQAGPFADVIYGWSLNSKYVSMLMLKPISPQHILYFRTRWWYFGPCSNSTRHWRQRRIVPRKLSNLYPLHVFTEFRKSSQPMEQVLWGMQHRRFFRESVIPLQLY